MSTKRSPSTAGFTIIETLIVLAIAGLILLIVFLAIPSLQRSSRNNQRKQDVQTILEAVSHYELNNSGDMPDCGHGASPSCTAADQPLQYPHLTYYNSNTDVAIQAFGSASAAATTTAHIANTGSPDAVNVYNYHRCDTAIQGDATVAAAGYTDVVALYAIESTTGTAHLCQQL